MFNYELLKKMKVMPEDEDGEHFIRRVIDKLTKIEREKDNPSKTYLDNIERLILENKIVLGSPVLKNILTETEPVSSCTIVPIDLRKDLENIKTILEPYAATTMGSGYDLNEVEDPCGTIEKVNSAIHELIQIYPNRLSAMGTLDISSPQILNFINLKRNRDFNTCHYNISVRIPDGFFRGVQEYEVIENGKTIKVTNQEILKRIAEGIHYCGEPGIIFLDRFNETNPLPQKKYEYKSVAPCAEIAMSEGEECQFSYVILSQIINEKGEVDKDELKLATQVTTRMLDDLCDISIKNAKANPDIIEDKRRIGVGVCGFADMLAKLNIPYDSEKSRKLAADIFTFINFYSKIESVNLSKERGCFRKYEESKCGKEEWYNRFRKNGAEWINELDWQTLINGIKRYGIRNSSTTAVPPTGRSAALVNASYSIEPYFSLYDNSTETGLNQIFIDNIHRNYPDSEVKGIIDEVLKMGDCSLLDEKYEKIKDVFKTAREIDPTKHIEIMSTINRCIDESISKTVNLPITAQVNDIYNYIQASYRAGLNGITFFRDRCLEERNLEEKDSKEER